MTSIVGLVSPQVIEQFFRARSAQDIVELIAAVEATGDSDWLPVGGTDVNVSAIEPGTNPPLQLIERVVNGYDGWLELMKARHPQDEPRSPFEAAQLWGQIPSGGVRMLSDKQKRGLAEGTVQVRMAESGLDVRPTVIVRDHGLGIHPDDYLATILSIHGRNKREKAYLHGAFGHGAATTLKFSQYTVIGSRLAPDQLSGRPDLVGATVIRFRPPRGNEKFGVYEYLAAKDGTILRTPAEAADDTFRQSHGVYVAHVSYDLKSYTADYKREKSGLWGLLNSVLFDPALPVQMQGERRKDIDGDPRASSTGRIASGNAALLHSRPEVGTPDAKDARGAITLLRDSFTLQLSMNDSVEVEFWVLDRDAETYVAADQQLTVTLNGQRHAARSRQWFKRLKFSYLARVMVVHVRADGLSYDSRRATFSTLREADVKEGYLEEVVLREVSDHLSRDRRLQELEEALHQADLARAASKASDSLRRRVAQRMDRALRGAGFSGLKVTEEKAKDTKEPTIKAGVGAPGAAPRGARPPQPPKPISDDAHLKFIPTTMTLEPGPHLIRQGAGCQLLLELDAKNDYLPAHKGDLRVSARMPTGELSPKITWRGSSRLLGGKCRMYFFAEKDAPLGLIAVEVELKTPKGILRSASQLEVIEPLAQRSPAATTTSGLPEIQWLKQKDWPPDWNEQEVGDVQVSRTVVTIRLNEDYAPLQGSVSRRKGKAIASFKNRYLLSAAVGLWMQEVFIEDKDSETFDDAMRAARRWIAAAAIEGIEAFEEKLDDEDE